MLFVLKPAAITGSVNNGSIPKVAEESIPAKKPRYLKVIALYLRWRNVCCGAGRIANADALERYFAFFFVLDYNAFDGDLYLLGIRSVGDYGHRTINCF